MDDINLQELSEIINIEKNIVSGINEIINEDKGYEKIMKKIILSGFNFSQMPAIVNQ